MIKTDELKGIIVASGYTQQEVAKLIDVTPNTFYRKMKKGVFGSDEMYKLYKVLNIKDPMAIFFAEE